MKKKINFLRLKLNTLYFTVLMMMAGCPMATNASTTTTTTSADDKWNTVIDFILPWITRLGGVVILIGAIEFGLGFKDNDADSKTKGMRTIIAGCIVTAVGLSANTFLA